MSDNDKKCSNCKYYFFEEEEGVGICQWSRYVMTSGTDGFKVVGNGYLEVGPDFYCKCFKYGTNTKD